MKKNIVYLLLCCIASCSSSKQTTIPAWVPYDETAIIAKNADNENRRLRYKRVQSKLNDKNNIWKNIAGQLNNFSASDYTRLTPLILEQDIPSIQASIKTGKLSYEKLTQWYLYRIVLYENDSLKALNSIIAINPDAVKQARLRDRNRSAKDHPLFGMPVLLKDNIGTEGMPTTAGAHALAANNAPDAFITKRIRAAGGIILGKANLSEWANYLCLDCPNGYSAMGGQTLNPYGAKIFDTGGSSSGSGASMAANYAVAAVGTETSGSILSPASANSVIGLKPTTGLLSRNGIVPLSGTFDTPGPMTRNLTDNAILLDAMMGTDAEDAASSKQPMTDYINGIKRATVQAMRFGVMRSLLTDSLYKVAVQTLVSLGAVAVEFDPPQTALNGFGRILAADMKAGLPIYLQQHATKELPVSNVADVIAFNKKDSMLSIPYGQGLFYAVEKEKINDEELKDLVNGVRITGAGYFEQPMQQYNLNMILSINNRHAGYAAAANFPCLTVPMGYRASGEPAGITFIARPYQELSLLKVGYAYEQATKLRQLPAAYK